MSESTDSHRQAATGQIARCAVLTISDSRTEDNDTGGDTIVSRLRAAGHDVVEREWVRDEPMEIGRVLTRWLQREGLQVIFTTGGTGVSSRDTTVEVVERFLEKRLDGFGELFRMLSFQEIGAAAMLSRSVAGLVHGIVVFALPGSVAAVELALDRLILPELEHLLWERRR
jgi:molybdenum cofactor biosynthesis protein B